MENNDKLKLLLIGMDAISKAEFLAKHPELADIEIVHEIPKSIPNEIAMEITNPYEDLSILSTPFVRDSFMDDNRSPRNIRRQKERDVQKFNKKHKK
jgi:hypothetical protein